MFRRVVLLIVLYYEEKYLPVIDIDGGGAEGYTVDYIVGKLTF